MPRLLRLSFLLALTLTFGCTNERDLPRLEGDWSAARLPARPYTHLVFRGYLEAFEITLDGRTIYAFDDAFARGRLRLHVVALPSGSAGKQLGVRVRARGDETAFGDEAILATPETLPRAALELNLSPLRSSATNILLGVAFIVAGVIGLIAGALRRRGTAVLSATGAFTLLYGTRLLIDSYLPLFFGASLRERAFAEAFLTYVITIPGWLVPLRMLGEGWRSTLRLQVIVFAIFAPIGIASDLITRTPGSLDTVNNVLVILGGLNILLNVRHSPRRHAPELRAALAGSVVFMIFAVGKNASDLGLLPWRQEGEALGLLVFVTTLAYAAARTFAREEREQLAIEHELTTAREIQRTLLPTHMPGVPGLAFRAEYEPATSVAGDLYDFLRIDEKHVGVLVADVSGHGVPAALIASMVKVAVSSQAARLASEPATLLEEVNTLLRASVRRAFVTATYLWFDMTQRTVSVCNAGHPPPLLYRDGEFVELGGQGVLLGRFAGVRYSATTIALQPGDRVVAFTDGVVEARNDRDEAFGEERLRELVARGNVSDVIAAVHRWRTVDDADDLTIVGIDVTP